MAKPKNDHMIEGSIHERMKEHKKGHKKHEGKKAMKHEGKRHEVHHYHHVVKGGKRGK